MGETHVVALLAGVLLAGVGGELFVRGSVGLARWARIPAGIIGATVAAFATSSPELAVAISAAAGGQPEIALGDALGSNISNVGLILGMALLFGALAAPRASIRRDFPVALLAPVLVGLLVLDGSLSRVDAALLLLAFLLWLGATVREARRQQSAAAAVLGEARGGLALLQCAAGLALLVAAGRFIVGGAKGIALGAGLDEFVIGATVVAVATSTPELATTLVARLRGHDEVGLGTILGSNVFNALFIAGVAAAIHPITVGWMEVSIGVAFGVLTLLAAYPGRAGWIGRGRGVLLLALFAAYLVFIIRLAPAA